MFFLIVFEHIETDFDIIVVIFFAKLQIKFQ